MLASTQHEESPDFREVVEESKVYGMCSTKHTPAQSGLKKSPKPYTCDPQGQSSTHSMQDSHGHQNALVMAPVDNHLK